jgi:hypothetical protein
MKTPKALIALIFAANASVGMTEPLARMQGAWAGSGWARETPQGPPETVRCRLENSFDDAAAALSITGQCVVPGRKMVMEGQIRGHAGSDRITGEWVNLNGIGSVGISGVQRGDIVAFTFRAKDPATGRDLAQNIEFRVSDGAL